jgi:dihydrofolate synthase/folylpolyglutamate synthase
MALSHLAEEASSRTLIFSCLSDKPADELAQILFPLFDRVILTPVDSPRSATLTQLSAAAQPTGTTVEESASPYDALDLAIRLTPRDGLIVATGSVLLVGAVRSTLELRESPEPASQESVPLPA